MDKYVLLNHFDMGRFFFLGKKLIVHTIFCLLGKQVQLWEVECVFLWWMTRSKETRHGVPEINWDRRLLRSQCQKRQVPTNQGRLDKGTVEVTAWYRSIGITIISWQIVPSRRTRWRRKKLFYSMSHRDWGPQQNTPVLVTCNFEMSLFSSCFPHDRKD